MSRVGARRESERVVPRATGVPRLAKPARHARYAREVDPFPVTPPHFGPAFTPGRQQARRAGAGGRRLVALAVAPHRPPIATDASGCRAYLVCRAGFAGRDTPLAQAIERYNSLSGPDPRCISGRLPSRPIAFPPGGRLDVTRAASALSTARDDDAARRGLHLRQHGGGRRGRRRPTTGPARGYHRSLAQPRLPEPLPATRRPRRPRHLLRQIGRAHV